jgi:DNA-binding cell septation regulator SpoVG
MYRGNHPSALPIVQTRTAMNYSMGIMKTMEFELADINHSFCDSTREQLQRIRELYVKAFKQNDPEAVDEFMDSSVACAFSLGKDRIIKAGKAVQEALPHVFPEGTVNWGVNYLLSLMAE